jgi:ElaB/YqjD/DUF883 family membrane-anchored ribosome-binding protein
MKTPTALLCLALSLTLPTLGQAQGLVERLRDKAGRTAEQIGEATSKTVDTVGGALDQTGEALRGTADKTGAALGSAGRQAGALAGKAVDKVDQTIEETRDSLSDEATPAETRAKLDAMAARALDELIAEEPGARDLLENSYGYAAFDTREIKWTVAAGYGRGVAVNRRTGERTYMKVASAGVGVGLGIGGFASRQVILFEDGFDFGRFVTQGVDASAEARTMAGDETNRAALNFEDGRAVFVLTERGWSVSAKAMGARYWPDKGLDASTD